MATSTIHPNHLLISSEDDEGTNVYDMNGTKIGGAHLPWIKE